MNRGPRDALLAAAALMAVGTALPWAWTRSLPWNEVESVGGFGHGATAVLAVAVLLAAAALMRRAAAAVIVAGLAAVVTTYIAWALPGGLNDTVAGAYEAGVGLGLDLALLGAFVAFCAAVAIVVQAFNDAALRSMARRVAQERWPA